MMTDVDVYGVTITSNTGSIVTGVFKFDGRLKSGQSADFTYGLNNPAGHYHDPAWRVLISRDRNGTVSVIRRVMKECSQKDAITAALTVRLNDLLADSTAHSWGGAGADPAKEFDDAANAYIADTKTERKPADKDILVDAAQSALKKAYKPGGVYTTTEQATSEDLLEIPDFLKRT